MVTCFCTLKCSRRILSEGTLHCTDPPLLQQCVHLLHYMSYDVHVVQYESWYSLKPHVTPMASFSRARCSSSAFASATRLSYSSFRWVISFLSASAPASTSSWPSPPLYNTINVSYNVHVHVHVHVHVCKTCTYIVHCTCTCIHVYAIYSVDALNILRRGWRLQLMLG